jgi:Leucine-rich repeat (LRR) protein
MNIIPFSLLLFILTSLETQAQSCKSPCPYYSDFVSMAQADTVKNTQTKLNYYRAAIVAAKDCHCFELEQSANKQIDTLFVLIEAEKRRAEAQSQMILQQQDSIEVALIDAEEANEKNLKIINAMDFYEGELALAFKNDKYGFINKIGDRKIDFSYDKGEPFNQETGFAEMQRGETKYLIDVESNEYKLIHVSETLKDVDNTKGLIYQEDIKWLENISNNEINILTLMEEEITVHQNKIKKDNIALEKETNEKIKGYWLGQIEAEKEALSLARSQLEKQSKNKQTEVSTRLDETRVKLNTIEEDLKIANDRLFNILRDGNEKLALDFSKQYNLDIIDLLQKMASDEFISNKVELLFLNETDLDRIPSFISKFKNLKELNISGTEIQGLPPSFKELVQLVRLDLSKTKLSTLPKDIGNLTALKYLNLLKTDLKKLPNNFSELKNLEVLNLNKTKIKTFPESVLQLSKLKELYSPYLIEEIPVNISRLKNLEILDLSSTAVKNLPESIGQLTNLKYLSLPSEIDELPLSISYLIKLESLEMGTTSIEVVPEGVWQLTKLKYLSLPFYMTELPLGILNLTNLESLDLSYTKIKVLPEEIGQLSKLKFLEMSPLVAKLPKSFTQLKNLEELYLNETEIKVFEGIENFTKLKVLELAGCPIDTLSDEICKLLQLTYLNLDRMKISNLPEDIGKLTKLTRLDFSNTAIKKVPASINELINLEELNFESNNIKKLPDMSNLKKLNYFSLTLYDENNSDLKVRLAELKENNPDCKFLIYDRSGNRIRNEK